MNGVAPLTHGSEVEKTLPDPVELGSGLTAHAPPTNLDLIGQYPSESESRCDRALSQADRDLCRLGFDEALLQVQELGLDPVGKVTSLMKATSRFTRILTEQHMNIPGNSIEGLRRFVHMLSNLKYEPAEVSRAVQLGREWLAQAAGMEAMPLKMAKTGLKHLEAAIPKAAKEAAKNAATALPAPAKALAKSNPAKPLTTPNPAKRLPAPGAAQQPAPKIP